MHRQKLILAVETSSRMGSVAIGNTEALLVEHAFSGAMRHSAEILPSVEGLLAQLQATADDLEQVYLSTGPGSFTGLRIAVTLAKAMHLASRVRIVAVDTLDVIAANVPAHEGVQFIAPILDAKRDRFFIAVYERESGPTADSLAEARSGLDAAPPGWVKIQADTIMTAEQFLHRFANPTRNLGILGDGLLYHKDRFQAEGVRVLDPAYWGPSAANVYRLGLRKALTGRYEDPLHLTPTYLLPPEVTLKARGEK